MSPGPLTTYNALMAYWRVSTSTIANMEAALSHEQWGAERESDLRRLAAGDRLVFSCSRGDASGYWALGTIASTVFPSTELIWDDRSYPFRVRFTVDTLLKSPLKMDKVRAVLSQVGLRLRYPPQSVVELTPQEFEVISRLVRKAASSDRSDNAS